MAGGFLIRKLATLLLCASPATASDLRPVEELDLTRYAGVWHEIARYPNRFQTECAGDVTATYTLRDDGKIDVVNRCRKKDGSITEAQGVARPASPPASRLKVRFAPAALSFLPFVWGDYWVIGLAPDYSWAVVGEPSYKYLWILAREPELDSDTYREILALVERQGYDPSRLKPSSTPPASGD